MPNEIVIDGVRYGLVPLDAVVEEAKAESRAAARPAPGAPWTVRDVARERGVKERTIRDEVKRRRIKPMRPSAPYRFSATEVQRYLDGGKN